PRGDPPLLQRLEDLVGVEVLDAQTEMADVAGRLRLVDAEELGTGSGSEVYDDAGVAAAGDRVTRGAFAADQAHAEELLVESDRPVHVRDADRDVIQRSDGHRRRGTLPGRGQRRQQKR